MTETDWCLSWWSPGSGGEAAGGAARPGGGQCAGRTKQKGGWCDALGLREGPTKGGRAYRRRGGARQPFTRPEESIPNNRGERGAEAKGRRTLARRDVSVTGEQGTEVRETTEGGAGDSGQRTALALQAAAEGRRGRSEEPRNRLGDPAGAGGEPRGANPGSRERTGSGSGSGHSLKVEVTVC